jgi:DNA-binding transcriptional LysR family regulator
MLDSRLLEAFVAVAETLHFGRAADRLQCAQSVLSRQIRALEQQVGTQLLRRGRRSAVGLTDAGSALLSESRTALAQLERAAVSARRAGRGEIGRLAIGYVASAALSGVLPRSLADFRVARPQVEIDLLAMETPRQLAALDDGSLDLGFLRPRSVYPEGVETRVVHQDDVLLAMATRHRLAHGQVDPIALAHERFIVPQFDEQDGFGELLQQLVRHGAFQPGPVLRVRDFVTAVTLAAAGYGLALVPRSVTAVALSGVVYRPISGFKGAVALVAAWRRNNPSPVLQALVARLPSTQER